MLGKVLANIRLYLLHETVTVVGCGSSIRPMLGRIQEVTWKTFSGQKCRTASWHVCWTALLIIIAVAASPAIAAGPSDPVRGSWQNSPFCYVCDGHIQSYCARKNGGNELEKNETNCLSMSNVQEPNTSLYMFCRTQITIDYSGKTLRETFRDKLCC